jgi:hypothetical protein
LHLPLQEHAPGERADHEPGSRAEGEVVADTEELPEPGQGGPAAVTRTYRFGSHRVHDPAAQLRRRLFFLRRERQQPRDRAKLLYLGLPLRVRREVVLELPAILLREGAEDVGVLELFKALMIHTTHLGTAASGDSK